VSDNKHKVVLGRNLGTTTFDIVRTGHKSLVYARDVYCQDPTVCVLDKPVDAITISDLEDIQRKHRGI